MKLDELSTYVKLMENDIHHLHIYCVGEEFLSLHEELNYIYEVLNDFYDFITESAISHNEHIENISLLLNTTSWNPVVGDKFEQSEIVEYVLSMGKYILDCVKQVTEYESWTQSKIDEFASDLDKIINYKMKQMLK